MIEIYTKDNCNFCKLAKNWLTYNELAYVEIELDAASTIKLKERATLPVKAAPQIFLNKEHIGGYDEMIARANEFKAQVIFSLDTYTGFVGDITSDQSKDLNAFIESITELNKKVNIARLMTASTGMASEGGEFSEIVKKCVFQGKPMDDATIFHMKRELGDVIWYWIQACIAIGENPNDVIRENVNKLESRYPGGFDALMSENRKDNDI